MYRDGKEVDQTPLAALRLTLEGLVSTVFLPQEVVRAALSLEPRYRRPIFLQLAGLERLQTLESSIQQALEVLKKSSERISNQRESIDTALKAQTALVGQKIKQLSEKLQVIGLPEEALGPEGAKRLSQQCIAALREFCSKYGLEMPPLPEVGCAEDLSEFVKALRSALGTFEAKCPETERQKELYRQQLEIQKLAAEYQEIEKNRQENEKRRQTIIQTHGTEEQLNQAIQQSEQMLKQIDEQIEQAGRYLKLLQEALRYFEALPDAEAEIDCPVCKKARVRAAHLREHLTAELEKAGLQPLCQRKKETEQNLQEKRQALKELLQLTEKNSQLEQRREKLVQQLGQLRAKPLGELESIELVLKELTEAVHQEVQQLETLLQQRNEAIQQVRSEVEKLQTVEEFLEHRNHLARLDAIPQLPEYRALEQLERRAEDWTSSLAELARAFRAQVDQAFQEKFAALKDDVNQFYQKLVGRRDFPEIRIDATNWEVQVGQENEQLHITRIFNVGDITAVALSLFLASAAKATHDAGFVLLDDPTQNLDEEHESRLAEILAELAQRRQVIVSTSRASFLQALQRAGTVHRQLIQLAPWDDQHRSCRLQEEIGKS